MKDPFKEALRKPSSETVEFRKEVSALLRVTNSSKVETKTIILGKVSFTGNKDQITLRYSPEMHSRVMSVWEVFLQECYWSLFSYDPDNQVIVTVFKNISTLRSGIETEMV